MPKNHRTQFNLKLVLSLLAIIVISWFNSRYFGTIRVKQYSLVFSQVVHCVALLAIAAIGYLNWKDYKEKWLSNLWVLLHLGVLALLGVLLGLYLIQGTNIHYGVLTTILAVRNAFTSPLPFFVFYLLTFANKVMVAKEEEKA
jgi:hypothetical protein